MAFNCSEMPCFWSATAMHSGRGMRALLCIASLLETLQRCNHVTAGQALVIKHADFYAVKVQLLDHQVP